MMHVAQQWRQFFEDIGVQDFLATERTMVTVTPQQLVSKGETQLIILYQSLH
jgi:hypothetical protein